MDIRPDPSALERLSRQRQVERTVSDRHSPSAPGQGPTANDGDQAEVLLDRAAAERFVATLRSMDPVDLHRVEDLRQRIADGSYRADPEELVDPLLDVIGDRREPRD